MLQIRSQSQFTKLCDFPTRRPTSHISCCKWSLVPALKIPTNSRLIIKAKKIAVLLFSFHTLAKKYLKMAPSTTAVVTGVLAASAVGYLVYFDYQRRHNPSFRKKLRKTNKKYQKAQDEALAANTREKKAQIDQVLKDSLASDPLPEDLAAKEAFFVAEIGRADELLARGEFDAAALAFYRALCVYPSPMELLAIYDKSLKPDVLETLRAMIVASPPPAILTALGHAAAGVSSAGAAAASPAPAEDTVE